MDYMAGLDCEDLADLLERSGYEVTSFESVGSAVFESVQFVGINPKCEFCYDVTFFDEKDELTAGRVYVRVNDKDEVEAEY